jgi:glycosidase
LQDVLTNGQESVYADWFDITDWGPPVQYQSWDGGGWMPNFRKDQRHGIASDSARQYLFDITKRWMDPNGDGDPSDGIDGWRLDVAPDVPHEFWIEWRQLVKGINPEAYIVGEHWGVAKEWLQGDQWDAVMNYQFTVRAVRYFINQQRRISASDFDRELRELLNLYPLQVDFVMQNLYDSHDTDRLVNMIVNYDRDYDQGNRPQDGGLYDGRQPGPGAYQILKMLVTFQMAFLGAPMIWYGDEVGMYGADDPTNRKPMLWRDLEPYDRAEDKVMLDVWQHYRRLLAIRNTYPALRTGLYRSWFVDDVQDVFGFLRVRGDDTIAVLLNNAFQPVTVDVPSPFPNGSQVLDVVTALPADILDAPLARAGFPGFAAGATVNTIQFAPHSAPAYTVRDGQLRLTLPAKSGMILVRP